MTRSIPEVFADHRLLLYYKGDISALTLFAQRDDSSVCFPQPLPSLSSALAEHETKTVKVSVHPAALVNAINQMLGLDSELLQAEAGYQEVIDTPQSPVIVYLARFKLLDPPHQLMQSLGCRLRTLPELRGRPPAEMELLRRAYVKVMEG